VKGDLVGKWQGLFEKMDAINPAFELIDLKY